MIQISLKFNNVCVSWSLPKTYLETNFLLCKYSVSCRQVSYTEKHNIWNYHTKIKDVYVDFVMKLREYFWGGQLLISKILIWLNHKIKTTNKTTAFSSVFSLFFQIVIFQYIAAILKILSTSCFIKSFKSILLGGAHAPTTPTSNLPMLCSYSVLYHKSTKKGIHFRLSNLCGVLLSLKKKVTTKTTQGNLNLYLLYNEVELELFMY